MKCWIFEISIYLLLPFIMFVFLCIRTIFLSEIKKYSLDKLNWNNQSPFLLWLMFIGELLSGTIYFVLDRNKIEFGQREPSKVNRALNISTFALQKVHFSDTKSTVILFGFLFLIAFLDGLSILGTFYVPSIMGDATQTTLALKGLQIISTGLLCYFILHFGLYRHQYLSIGLSIIGVALVSWNHFQKEIQSFEHIITLLGIIILSSLHETIVRYIMDEKRLHPIKVLFYEGLIGTILIGLIILILSFIHCPNSLEGNFCELNEKIINLPDFFENVDWFIGFFLFVWFICSAVFNFFARLLIYYLTPTHRSLAEMLSSFSFWIYMQIIGIQNENTIEFTSTVIGYIILIFGYLIYNEIVTIRLCELDYYTKKGISRRCIVETPILEPSELAIDNVKDVEELYIDN